MAAFARGRALEPVIDTAAVEKALIAEATAISNAGNPKIGLPILPHLRWAVDKDSDRTENAPFQSVNRN